MVEGLLKTVVHRQLGPYLGDYLRAATDGLELEMEVGVFGVPIRTFDAPIAEWASGKLNPAAAAKDGRDAERVAAEAEAAAEAAGLLGLSREHVRMLLSAASKLPAHNPDSNESFSAFNSVGHMMRYFRSMGLEMTANFGLPTRIERGQSILLSTKLIY